MRISSYVEAEAVDAIGIAAEQRTPSVLAEVGDRGGEMAERLLEPAEQAVGGKVAGDHRAIGAEQVDRLEYPLARLVPIERPEDEAEPRQLYRNIGELGEGAHSFLP